LIARALSLSLLVFACGPAFAESDPIMGRWIYVPTASTYSNPAQALARASATYEPFGQDGLKFTSEIVRQDGSIVRRGWSAAFDGKDHEVTGDPAFDAVALRRVNRYSFMFIYKKAGRILSAQVRDVSPDLKTMTLIQLGVTASGSTTNNTVIFTRE
jgi:hypothetical protein